MFGVLTDHDVQAYTVIGGWELNVKHVFIGLSRLLYPFFAGLLLSRMMRDTLSSASDSIRRRGFARRGFWICSLLLVVIFLTLTFFSIAEKLYLIFRQLAKFLAKKG